MGGINSLSGLNKVNVDYRPSIEEPNVPKSTDANRPQPEPQGAAPAGPIAAEAEANPAEAPEQNPVVKLVSQLDVLLMKAAKASTKSLDGDISVRKQNGRTKRIGGQVAMNVHLLDCPSYFTRDYFDKIFA